MIVHVCIVCVHVCVHMYFLSMCVCGYACSSLCTCVGKHAAFRYAVSVCVVNAWKLSSDLMKLSDLVCGNI